MRALEDAAACNAKQQQSDKTSVLAFWKRMLALRKQYNDLFVHGEFDVLDLEDKDVFVYTKTWRERKAVVVCNFTAEGREWEGKEVGGKKELLVSTVEGEREGRLEAFEGRIYLLA